MLCSGGSESGDITGVQKYSAVYSDAAAAYSNYNASDAAIIDASFIRLKNVYLSWQLPNTCVRKIKIENSKLFLQGQNLFTITDYRGLTPRIRVIRPYHRSESSPVAFRSHFNLMKMEKHKENRSIK